MPKQIVFAADVALLGALVLLGILAPAAAPAGIDEKIAQLLIGSIHDHQSENGRGGPFQRGDG